MSGIYIPGMEMPTDRSRWVVIYPDGKVDYSDKTDEWETLDKGAVPVPEHGRLGDLDELLDRAFGCLDEDAVHEKFPMPKRKEVSDA